MVVEGDLSRAFVSYPSLFKHLAFDGRFLHGVPENLAREAREARDVSTCQREVGSCKSAIVTTDVDILPREFGASGEIITLCGTSSLSYG